MALFSEMMDEAGEMRDQIVALETQLAKVGRNWSSGKDEQFGGRFVCVHGLSEKEADDLVSAGKAALSRL